MVLGGGRREAGLVVRLLVDTPTVGSNPRLQLLPTHKNQDVRVKNQEGRVFYSNYQTLPCIVLLVLAFDMYMEIGKFQSRIQYSRIILHITFDEAYNQIRWHW